MVSNYIKTNAESKERLKDISHHFFGSAAASDTENGVQGIRPMTFLPVLLASDKQASCLFSISDYFNTKNKLCAVVNVDRTLPDSFALTPSFELPLTNKTDANRAQIGQYLKGIDLSPEICLLPYASHKIALINDGDFLLVIVPASLSGVRHVFHELESVCSSLENVVVGVIVTDAKSMQMSQLCYDVMANSISSFLGLKSVVLGHLLSDTAVDFKKERLIQFSNEADYINSAPIEPEDIAKNVWATFTNLLVENRTMNILSQGLSEDDIEQNMTKRPFYSFSD